MSKCVLLLHQKYYRRKKMNIDKRNNYDGEMVKNGIDTFSGYICTNATEIPKEVSQNIAQFNIKKPNEKIFVKVNANKSASGERLVTRYKDFVTKVNQILNAFDCKYEDMDIVRADFCFNSANEQSFEDYQKLHRLILSCLAKAYEYKNCYVSCNLWDFERLSIAIKKDDSEAENYNRARASDGRDESANRLELRSKRMSGTNIKYQFMEKWFERLDKSLKQFENVQEEYNNHLEKLYKEDLAKPKKERNYLSLESFLLQYKECIYARKQMIDLMGRFEEVGKEKAEKRADKFKEKHKIEYFSKADLRYIIDVLKQKTREYFEE